MPRRPSAPWVLLLVLLSTAPAGAQERPLQGITDVAQVDNDYWYQGEYLGSVWTDRGTLEPAGLQVVARGDGAFEAVYYPGGLPGNGWNRRDRLRLGGRRQGLVLELAGERLTATLPRNNIASLRWARTGATAGELKKVVRTSRTLGAPPPRGALALFQQSGSTEHFRDARLDENGLLMVGAETVVPVRDFTLHVEFRLPYQPHDLDQKRGNSGLYLQRRYEVQILDSFGLDGLENQAGALYRQKAPDVNMAFPPLEWQTYDIDFRAARFDESGNKVRNARITVRHNGILVQDCYEIVAKTGNGKAEAPEPLPILLQNHGNPVLFRNIWLIHRDADVQPDRCDAAPGGWVSAPAGYPACQSCPPAGSY